MLDNLVIAGRAFNSRLIVGTGKYRSFQEMARAHAASGADMVTVQCAREPHRQIERIAADYIDREKIFILPNTAACYTADEAIRTARLGRRSRSFELGSSWKSSATSKLFFPVPMQLIRATRVLVKKGFVFSLSNDRLAVRASVRRHAF